MPSLNVSCASAVPLHASARHPAPSIVATRLIVRPPGSSCVLASQSVLPSLWRVITLVKRISRHFSDAPRSPL